LKKLIIIIMAVLLGTGIAFAANQNGKGTSGDQGTGHGTAGNQGNNKGVGNGGGRGDVGCGACGNGGGSDDGGTVSVNDGPVGSFGVGTNGKGGGSDINNSANTGDSGYGFNRGDSDPQRRYGNLREPKCTLIDWFNNDFDCSF
jgi:hypothetical protein